MLSKRLPVHPRLHKQAEGHTDRLMITVDRQRVSKRWTVIPLTSLFFCREIRPTTGALAHKVTEQSTHLSTKRTWERKLTHAGRVTHPCWQADSLAGLGFDFVRVLCHAANYITIRGKELAHLHTLLLTKNNKLNSCGQNFYHCKHFKEVLNSPLVIWLQLQSSSESSTYGKEDRSRYM